MASLPVEEYHVGWVCALPTEMTAAKAMLDEEHEMIHGQDPQDHNSYALGRVHKHNVVIACMPAGVDGIAAAATVAKDMLRTFTALRFGLMVGIGGGIPDVKNNFDIRLGDIVVSQPTGTNGGVIQYDKGKSLDDGKFDLKGILNAPPAVLLNALASLEADHGLRDSRVPGYLSEMVQRYPKMNKTGYKYPGAEKDCLFCATCSIGGSCEECDQTQVRRNTRDHSNPEIYYGVIASGNQVIKNAVQRNRLRAEFGARCVEMEAAGLMNNFPCLVIRGICDYADSHKNDAWHKYAAATAAAFAKELLLYVSAERTCLEKPIRQVLDILNEHLQVVKEHLQATKEQDHKKEIRYQHDTHRDCHRNFKTSAYETMKNINPDRVDGTCNWVLTHRQFCQWHDNPHNDLLWISADPGCGKSVLSKSLVDYELQNTVTHTVCYFFFKENDQQNSLATALCALIHQIFAHQPQLVRHAIKGWEKSGDKLNQDVDELWRIFLAVGSDPVAGNVSCVLDALDECRENDRRRLMTMLSTFYINSCSSTPQGRWLKFLVTSRPYDDIQTRFQHIPSSLPTIRLRGEDENDHIRQEIDLVIRVRVERLAADLKLNHQTREQLQQRLLGMEHRTYLWLYLAIEGIYEIYRDSLRPDEESIESLPFSVEDAYEKILKKVTPRQQGTVKKILEIVVGARRPLTVGEMTLALGVATSPRPNTLVDLGVRKDHLEQHIRQWCGLFVFTNQSRIYLIHQTAKEFLIRGSDSGMTSNCGWKHFLDPLGTERSMTQICVEYLCLRDLTKRDLDRDHNSATSVASPASADAQGRHNLDDVQEFFSYSAEHWPSHLRCADLEPNDDLLTKLCQLYDTKTERFNTWFSVLWKAVQPYEDQPDMNEVRLAAFNGHELVLRLFLEGKKLDVDAKDGDGRTALIWASELGHEKAAQFLIKKGADVNARGGQYGNPLLAASVNGHDQIVQLLLKAGVEVNVRVEDYSNDRTENYSSPLQAASVNGHRKVVRLLLDNGAKVNAPRGEYRSALHGASLSGQDQIVQFLIEKGANVEEKDLYGRVALHHAARNGHKAVVQRLLDRQADIEAMNDDGETPLVWAAREGHETVVELLLEKGADIEAKAFYSQTALQSAAGNGHVTVVKQLLEAGADVAAQSNSGWTALHAAANFGHGALTLLLLEKGPNLEAKYDDGMTALHMASRSGYASVVQLLLAKEADIEAKDDEGRTALHMASCCGYVVVVQLLLAKEANIEAKDDYGRTALQTATNCGYEEVKQLLLTKGANVKAMEKDEETALGETMGTEPTSKIENKARAFFEAVCSGNEVVARQLLDEGVDTEMRDEHGITALCRAAQYGHEIVVRLLLNKKVDIEATTRHGGTALCWAARYEHEAVERLLLEEGADVNACTAYGETALEMAASSGHEVTVQLLLEKGADDTQKTHKVTALIHAAMNGHVAVAQLLLKKGADIAAKGRDGRTALHEAARAGHIAVVCLLLEQGADFTAKDHQKRTALHWAAETGHYAVARILIESGVDLEAKDRDWEIHGGTALHRASKNGHEDMVQLLLQNGANIEAKDVVGGETALCWAASEGYDAVVRVLLENGADIQGSSKNEGEALRRAAERGHEKVVRLLLENGADIDASSQYGETALRGAAGNGHEKVVRLLLDSGANVEALTGQGGTALHQAAGGGHEEVVQLLLEKGANIEAETDDGETAIQWAAQCGEEAVVRLLLQKGAHLETNDMSGQTQQDRVSD